MDIERTRGDTTPDVAYVTMPSGESANITGCVFTLVVDKLASPVDATTRLYQISGAIADAATGRVEFAPTTEQVDRVGYFYYQIKMVDSYGKVFTPAKGMYVFTPSLASY